MYPVAMVESIMAAPSRICVFAGSAHGSDPAFATAARDLGAELAARNLGLVFGGETAGLMGAVADGALAAGGKAIGVIPRLPSWDGAPHPGVEQRFIDTLAERKQLMADLADAFIALPGGLGTLDELTEMVTWGQLGIQRKRVVMLDARGYWTPFAELLDAMVAAGFLQQAGRALLRFESSPAAAVDAAVER
jgi:uncharacterized protein (TIGR00730 family)